MRVERNYDVKKIILGHDGTKEKIACTYKRAGEALTREELLYADPVIIGFKDVYEIDMLINLLQRFRTGVMTNMGHWERAEEEKLKKMCKNCKHNTSDISTSVCSICDITMHSRWEPKED